MCMSEKQGCSIKRGRLINRPPPIFTKIIRKSMKFIDVLIKIDDFNKQSMKLMNFLIKINVFNKRNSKKIIGKACPCTA